MDVVNLEDKFRGFSEEWSPRIVGDLNDMHVKVVKPRGACACSYALATAMSGQASSTRAT